MPTYEGQYFVITQSRKEMGHYFDSPTSKSRARITTTKPHSGVSSLEIPHGGFYEIWYGCDAGEKTISIYCWKNSGCVAAMEIIDPDTNQIIASDFASSSETWEKLEVTFTAQKKVYLVRLVNYTPAHGTGPDRRIYFDDLE